MSKISRILMLAVMMLSLVTVVGAQSKTMGDTTVVKGTVEAVDQQARVVTVKDTKGKFVTVDVPEGAKNLSKIKVGDKVSLRYYDGVTVRLKQAGEAAVDSSAAAKTPAEGKAMTGTVAKQRTITAVIQEIDPKVPSITFTGPNGWKYSRRVQDKKILEKVKVGDRVDFTWTEAVMIDIESPK